MAALVTAVGSLFAAGDAALQRDPRGAHAGASADGTEAGGAFRRFTADPLRVLSRWLVGRVVALSVRHGPAHDAAQGRGPRPRSPSPSPSSGPC